MTDGDVSTRRASVPRRRVLRGLGGILGAAAGSTAASRAQTPTQTDPGGGAQVTTNVLVPDVGQPFAGDYVGQFVIFTDPTPNDDVSPDGVATCDFATWSPGETRGYEGLLVDRLTDDPRGVEVPLYVNEARPQIEVGTVFVINQTHPCPDGLLGLELERVPARSFAPEYGTVEHPLVGEEPGPGLTPTDEPGGIDAPGQPGFGAAVTVVAVGVVAWIRRLVSSTDDAE